MLNITVVNDGAVCSCDINDNCDCMPGFLCLINGAKGGGYATWCHDDERHENRYWCQMLGYEFWADCQGTAAEELSKRLSWASSVISVKAR